MSLLSSFDDVSLLQPDEEETNVDKDKEEAPKLPRTNSLEDLGIKVLQFDLVYIYTCLSRLSKSF